MTEDRSHGCQSRQQSTLQGTGTLTVDTLNWSAGTMTGSGTTTVEGGTINGAVNLSRTLQNAGTLEWQGGFGTQSGATHMQGDANADGNVDGNDFLLWQSQFGSAVGGAAVGAVPEPNTFVLTSLALIPLFTARGRRAVPRV